MPNIKFNYLYRDAGNYKNYGSVIFASPSEIDLAALKILIRSKLFDETWFYHHEWQVTDLHFGTWDNELDHTWHEFESIEHTNEAATSGLSLPEFIEVIKQLPFS
ncbi:hypothetical protein A0256_06930 [Mucilaginibacter sp. PAMC 26640]|nr:hypothetical protein A0256_06930 [Mucilaginibacter sp. PAMC 26640]